MQEHFKLGDEVLHPLDELRQVSREGSFLYLSRTLKASMLNERFEDRISISPVTIFFQHG